MTLDRTKLIKLPSGNTLKWREAENYWYCYTTGMDFDTRDLEFILGDNIKQVDAHWWDLFALAFDEWEPANNALARDNWEIYSDGSAAYFGEKAKAQRHFKFDTPAKALEVINQLIEAEQS